MTFTAVGPESAGMLGLDDRDWFHTEAVVAGVIAAALGNVYALANPLFTMVGGAFLAGLIPGYALGDLRGILNGVIAGFIGGALTAGLVGFTGLWIGLYNQPTFIVGQPFGLLPLRFDGGTWLGFFLILAGITLLSALDALFGAAVGAAVRTGVREVKELRSEQTA